MDVYDSNIWILGLTGEVAAAEALVEEAAQAERFVSVTPYIYQEVYEGFVREFKTQKAMDHVADFSTLIARSGTIKGPTQAEIEAVDLDDVRTRDENILLAGLLHCQVKDVPIVLAAFHRHNASGETSTIYTADKEFSEITLEKLDISGISIQYIEY